MARGIIRHCRKGSAVASQELSKAKGGGHGCSEVVGLGWLFALGFVGLGCVVVGIGNFMRARQGQGRRKKE